MQPSMDISEEDEAILLESISKHNKLAREYNNSSCETRKAEVMRTIEQLRTERQLIIKKYEKVEEI